VLLANVPTPVKKMVPAKIAPIARNIGSITIVLVSTMGIDHLSIPNCRLNTEYIKIYFINLHTDTP
jgi:hypothetical protein